MLISILYVLDTDSRKWKIDKIFRTRGTKGYKFVLSLADKAYRPVLEYSGGGCHRHRWPHFLFVVQIAEHAIAESYQRESNVRLASRLHPKQTEGRHAKRNKENVGYRSQETNLKSDEQ